ncbi:MAG TPA: hypothetical protein VG370_12650 [Chloroflexota bacterium]|jgi:hypothetical protein|nr:hypothetical protein [Chloroflexota bacterium]
MGRVTQERLQTWVAVRWRSFAAALGLEVGSTILGIMLLRSLKNIQSTPYGPYLWRASSPGRCRTSCSPVRRTAELRETALLAGLVGGVVVAVLGCWEIVRRDVL